MQTTILSAGHSLSDPGAVYPPGAKENFMTMELTKLVADYLRAHSIGVLTVPDDLSLINTIKWVNNRASESKVELCVEIHTNASTDKNARGVEAWYYHDFATGLGDEESKKLSQCLVDAINVESGLISRGVFDESTNKWGRLGFVHDTKPLASLVECGFLSNPNDCAILLTEKGRKDIAKGITRGILTYLGEAWKPEVITPTINPSTEDTKDKLINSLKEELDALKKSSAYNVLKLQDQLDSLKGSLKKDLQSIINRLS